MTIRWVLGLCLIATVAATACDHHDAPEVDGEALRVVTDYSVDIARGGGSSESEEVGPMQASSRPCAARNPIRLVAAKVIRNKGKPQAQISSFQLPIAAPVCVRVTTLDMRHPENLKDVSVDGESIVGKRGLDAANGAFQTELQLDAGLHELSVVLAGKPGTAVEIEVSVPGPVIDSFAPSVGKSGTPIVVTGEGFLAPLTVRIGTSALLLNGSTATSLQATTVAGLEIGPITVTTPFGSAVSADRFAPTDPKGVVWTLDRFVYPASPGSGLSSFQVVDDGRNFAAVLLAESAIEPSASVKVELLSSISPDAPIVRTLTATAPCSAEGLCLSRSTSAVAVTGPLQALGTLHPEGMGRALLRLTVQQSSSTVTFPDANSPWANGGYFDVKPVVAPRYLRFLSTDGQTVASRHGATLLQTANDGEMNLIRIRDDQTLEDALKEFIQDSEAVGVFPDPMAYPLYVPVGPSGGPASDCVVGNEVFDLGAPGDPPIFGPDGGLVGGLKQRHLEAINVRGAWQNDSAGNPRGSGVTIIVADTGVLGSHNELSARINFAGDRNLLPPLQISTTQGTSPHGHPVSGLLQTEARRDHQEPHHRLYRRDVSEPGALGPSRGSNDPRHEYVLRGSHLLGPGGPRNRIELRHAQRNLGHSGDPRLRMGA